jgi:5-methylcytosine-specific restriction protein B
MSDENGFVSGEYVGENYNAAMLQQIVAAYKADFHRIDDEEHYKWEALGHYKQHWNIDADNFAEMYHEAFRWAGEKYISPRNGEPDGGNLLTSQMYYAYAMMSELAAYDPEKMRALFRTLYSKDISLAQRYKEFRAGCDQCLEEKQNREPNRGNKGLKHYQDLHAISVYLAFEQPEKYYIYKYSAYEAFRKLIDFPKEKDGSDAAKLENYNRMCELVLKAVKADPELLALSRNRLHGDCYKNPECQPYQDPDYHLLVSDVIYFAQKIDKEKLYMMNDTHTAQPGHGTDIGKNMILYGPPGTGKTYHTVLYAVAIIENKPIAEIEKEPYDTVMKRFNQYKEKKQIEFTTFHQSYGYEEFIEGIKPTTETDDAEDGDIEYHIESGLFKEFCERADQATVQSNPNSATSDGSRTPHKNYVFIIDEINRGNISKIFGELITLIEPSKRIGQPEEMTAKLPYSKKAFGVPDNVYLLGTMNTADRSIATIDTALRRRFQFREMQPDPSVLDGIEVAGISISQMLSDMNQKISVLYDREHTIGHSYFLPLKSNPTIETLAQIFKDNIIPLLQEYFYDDYAKIRLVLGDNKKTDASTQFIMEKREDLKTMFGNTELDLDDSVLYKNNPSAFLQADAYRSILIAQDTPTTSTLSD